MRWPRVLVWPLAGEAEDDLNAETQRPVFLFADLISSVPTDPNSFVASDLKNLMAGDTLGIGMNTAQLACWKEREEDKALKVIRAINPLCLRRLNRSIQSGNLRARIAPVLNPTCPFGRSCHSSLNYRWNCALLQRRGRL